MYLLYLVVCIFWGFPGGLGVKIWPANAGDTGSTPGWGRSPGGGNSNPLQYSGMGNPMDRGLQSMGLQRVRHGLVTKHHHH